MKKVQVIMLFIVLIKPLEAKDCQYLFSGIVRAQLNVGHILVINEKSKSEKKIKIAPADLINFAVYLNKFVAGKTYINVSDEAYGPRELYNTIPDPLQLSGTENFKLIGADNCGK
jgi:hypothetical protein